MFKNKTVLITGGPGSWGSEATRKLLTCQPKEIRIFARHEFSLIEMQRKFNNPLLKFIMGDIRDYETIEAANRGVDYVLHLAALKQAPWAEEYPTEFIKTNIVGTENVIKAAIKNNIKRVVIASSDKACEPSGVYGATKLIAERLILHANSLNSNTEFQCIRGGNVMGSRGSAIQFFIDQIKTQNRVTLTDEKMTRYFITIAEAIDLVFLAVESSILNATYIINMRACRILDLIKVLIKHYGNKTTEIEIIGLRLGEKLHEVLISKTEALNSYIYNDNYYLIFPFHDKNVTLPKVKFAEYNSSTNLMSEKEIETMLRKGGFLQ